MGGFNGDVPGVGQAETVAQALVFEPVTAQCSGRTEGHLVTDEAGVHVLEY